MTAHDAVTTPRFGSVAWDFASGQHYTAYWLDPRVSSAVRKEALDKFAVGFTQEGYIDTGLGDVAIVNDDGSVEGAIAPMSSIGQSATKILGIGAKLGTSTEGRVYVDQVILNSPAERARLLAGDIILAIQTNEASGFVKTDGMAMNDVLALIRGPLGSVVQLQILRGNQNLTFKLTRDEIKIAP